jgi:[protein-PII] uridylyltransferase
MNGLPSRKESAEMGVERRETDPQARRRHLADRLAAARADFAVAARAGRGGRAVQARYAGELDEIVRLLVDAAGESGSPAVVGAIGGYGRRTLCLHSDIDLLIVFEGPIGAVAERFAKAILQPLWDLKLTVGQHVREIRDFDALDDTNPELLLSLSDLRLLAGDVRLFDDLVARVDRDAAVRAPRLVAALVDLVDARHRSFNSTLYQLEPDIKNAPGGLRDIGGVRLLRTLAREAFAVRGRSEGERLDEAEEFLLRLRSLLHLQYGRDGNVLTHELQERVARPLGFDAPDPHQQVEALMGAYFRHARTVARSLAWSMGVVRPSDAPAAVAPVTDVLAVGADGVQFRDSARAAVQPTVWLDAFALAIETGKPVSDDVLSVVQTNVGRYTADYFTATPEMRGQIRTMLRPRPGLSARLSDMLECGLLGAVFPEFEKIHCRVTRDFYHRYTVDEHTLLAIQGVESLWHPSSASRARFGSILNEIHAPELLTLALLYHDVGKWRDGEHVNESGRLARPMLARLQLPAQDRQVVEFLIENHLAMSRVVFRRDFTDPDTVAQFAALVGTEEILKKLCLLTLVDIEAVGPGTLTPWKEDLLWRLYVDAYNHLTLGYADELIQKDLADRSAVVAERPADISEIELARFLRGLPRRYLSVFGLSTIYQHVRLARGLLPDELHAALEKRDDVWELTVAALDKPFLFSNIAGVLSYFGMNIHRGQAMTTPDHLVLDVFEFSDDEGFLRQNAAAREEIARVLKGAVAGTTDVAALLRGRRQSVLHRRRRAVGTHVHLDNEHSQKYTVVEIVTDDAPGLLHRVSRVVSDHGCDVDLVLISTEGHKAVDVLHVTNAGRKLDEASQGRLKRDLERTLEGDYETD